MVSANGRTAVRLSAVVIGTLLLLRMPAMAQVTISLGTAIGAPGQRVLLPVTINSAGIRVGGVQNDITFAREAVVVLARDSTGSPDCFANHAIPLEGSSFSWQPAGCAPGIDCTGIRALVISFSGAGLPDGELVYGCRVQIDAQAVFDTYAMRCSFAGSGDVNGNALRTNCTDGEIHVVAQPPTPTATDTPVPTRTPRPPTRTPRPTVTHTPTATGTPCDPPCAAVRVGSATGRPGERVRFSVQLDAQGHEINGLQADLGFDARAPIAADPHGNPVCSLAPGLFAFLPFSFHPPSCGGRRQCTGIRAVVAPLRPIVIADGSELFTCTINVAANAPEGVYSIGVSNVAGSTSTGEPVPMTGTAGAIVVSAGSPTHTATVPPLTATPTATPSDDASRSDGTGCQIAEPSSGTAIAWLSIPVAVRRVRRIRRPGKRLRNAPYVAKADGAHGAPYPY
jgi:hypothetical protein